MEWRAVIILVEVVIVGAVLSFATLALLTRLGFIPRSKPPAKDMKSQGSGRK